MDIKLRPSGIEGVGAMPWGTHFCLFYQTKEDLLDILIPYFKAGLENNEFFLCVASLPLSTEEAQQAMQEAVPDFERYLSEGQIEIVSYREWLLTGGKLDTQRVLQNWIDKLNQVLAKGYAGLRFLGDPSWLDKQAWGSVPEFEKQLDQIVSNSQMLGLCAYALERCSAADVLEVVNHHQFTVVKRKGVWEHLESSELKRAHDEIGQLNADLERRVLERTAQLAAANEQLRQEVSERKQAEALLHAREQEFRAIVENAPDQIIRYNREFRRSYVNPAVAKAFGLPAEALIGKPIGSLVQDAGLDVQEDEVAQFRQRIAAVFDTGESYEYESSRPMPTGRRYYSIHLFPERDLNGSVINVLGIARDITERQRAEEALRKSERVLREAEALGHTGSWEQNLVTGEIFNTEENLRLFFGDDHSKGADFEDYAEAVHPDDREYVMQRRVQLLTDRGPSDIEYRVVWPDGSVHVIFGRVTVVYDELGQALRVYGTNVDITERKRVEEELRESEEKFSAAFRASPMALVIATLDGKYVEMNQAFCELLGYSREELLGKTAVDIGIFNAETRREWLEAIERAGRVMTNVEFNFRLRNGISRTTLFSAETITFHGVPHHLTTILDITARKAYEATLNSLLHISQNLHRNLETDKLLESLIIEAMILTDSKLGWVGLPTEKGMTLVRHVSHNFEVLPFEYTWPPNVGWPGWVLVHKVPYVSNDADSDNVIVPEIRERFGVKSGIDTPILDAEGNILGFFEVNNKTNGGGYSEYEVELLLAVSRIASVALQNASSYQNLQRTEESIKSLSLRLMNMQESERRALTTELHDRIGQNLTGLSINLQNMKASLPDETAKILATKFDDAQALVEDTTRQIRDLMSELYLPELEEYGLAAALEIYAERAASRGNLELIADLPDLAPLTLPSDVRIALFRSAQEAISNVLKHADATQLEVSLEQYDSRVRLRVGDDGRGFEPDSASQKEAPTWGLKIMRERIESIGGKVQIESEPGEGTRVIFEIERPS